MYKILIVEDDSAIADSMCSHLSGWGYECVKVTDFRHVTELFAAENPQLVLMDISLPFFNGYHWCSELRKLTKIPIIFVSSASDNMNIIMAVNMGGDDFITKPFDLSVLSAKVQAMMRRTYDFNSGSDLIEHAGVIVNLSDSSVLYNGNRLELSRNEFRILETLFENRGKIVSREKLMKRLWETDCFVDENTLNVNVARLRKRLESIGVGELILTKKGEGYIVG